jgi:hypothetical protein
MTTTDHAAGIPTFVPRAWLRNGHVMTVFAWGRSASFPPCPR